MGVALPTAVALAAPEARASTTLLLLPVGVVSLPSRLPLGLLPAPALATPPASVALALSATALGSLLPEPRTVMYRVAVLVAPLASRML